MKSKINIPENPKIALSVLYKNGFEGYLVGGCVRDSVLGRVPFDYDITTNALPHEIKRCFDGFNVIETGIIHGTVTVVINGENIEITTYRSDGEYLDGRHPSQVTFTRSLKEDLARRDFTMNALAYSEESGIVDFFGGLEDIENKIIRTVGNPYERFCEDKLRIMRALRFCSELSFTIEEKTRSEIFRLKDGLDEISVERISAELDKLIMGENVFDVLTDYAEVLSVFIPEIKPCIDFEQHNPYHIYTVWEHIAKSVSVAVPKKVIRLSMLFHDIGKPRCFSVDEKGIGHFYGHEEISAEMSVEILKRLKKDNDTIRTVRALVEKHYTKPSKENNGEFSKKQTKKLLQSLGEDNFFLLTDVLRADAMAKAEFALDRLPVIDRMEALARKIIEENECFSLKSLAVDGNDVMTLGFSGKDTGKALQFLLDAVIGGDVPNEKERLIEYLTKSGL